MRIVFCTAAAAAIMSFASPASAQRLSHLDDLHAKPKAISTIDIAEKRLDFMATTRRARADTPLERDHVDECQAMAKVIPGYPQPAFVSLGVRVRF